jgi:hypothetical protein
MARGIGWWRAVVLAACLCTSACSIERLALRKSGAMMLKGMSAMNGETDFEIFKMSLPPNLKTLEILLASDPDNPDFLFLLAQGWGAYAQIVIEDEIDQADAAGDTTRVAALKARATALYRKGQTYAATLLGPPLLIKTIETGTLDQAKAELKKLTRVQLPGLLWYAFNWVGQINLNQSDMTLVAGLPRVELLVNRAVELQPDYFYGMPLLTAGGLASARPAMLGGDLKKGKELLDKAVAVTQGRFLLAKFMYAKLWAVQAQDHAAFCGLLKDVILAADDLLPEQQMMNTIAKIWARRWRDRAGDVFAEGGACDSIQETKQTEGDDDSLE